MATHFTIGKYDPSCVFQKIPWCSGMFSPESEAENEDERLNNLQKKLPSLKHIVGALKTFGRNHALTLVAEDQPTARTRRIHNWMESKDSSFIDLRRSCKSLAATTLARYRILDVAADLVEHDGVDATAEGGANTFSSPSLQTNDKISENLEKQELSPSKDKIFTALMDGNNMVETLERLVVRGRLFSDGPEDTSLPQDDQLLIDSAVRHDRKSDYHKIMYNFEMAACVLKALMDSDDPTFNIEQVEKRLHEQNSSTPKWCSGPLVASLMISPIFLVVSDFHKQVFAFDAAFIFVNKQAPRSSPLTLLERRIWKTIFDITINDGKTHDKLRELFKSNEYTDFITDQRQDGHEVSRMLSMPPPVETEVDSDLQTLGKRPNSSDGVPGDERDIGSTSNKRGKKSTTKTPRTKSRPKKKVETSGLGTVGSSSIMNGSGVDSQPKPKSTIRSSSNSKKDDYHQNEENSESNMGVANQQSEEYDRGAQATNLTPTQSITGIKKGEVSRASGPEGLASVLNSVYMPQDVNSPGYSSPEDDYVHPPMQERENEEPGMYQIEARGSTADEEIETRSNTRPMTPQELRSSSIPRDSGPEEYADMAMDVDEVPDSSTQALSLREERVDDNGKKKRQGQTIHFPVMADSRNLDLQSSVVTVTDYAYAPEGDEKELRYFYSLVAAAQSRCIPTEPLYICAPGESAISKFGYQDWYLKNVRDQNLLIERGKTILITETDTANKPGPQLENNSEEFVSCTEWTALCMKVHDLKAFEVTREGCQTELRVKKGAIAIFVAARGDRDYLGDPTLIHKDVLISERQLLDNSWLIELVILTGSNTLFIPPMVPYSMVCLEESDIESRSFYCLTGILRRSIIGFYHDIFVKGKGGVQGYHLKYTLSYYHKKITGATIPTSWIFSDVVDLLFLLNAAILWRAISSPTYAINLQGEELILQVADTLNAINDRFIFRLDNRVVKFTPIFYNFLTQHIRCFVKQATAFYNKEELNDPEVTPIAVKETISRTFCHNSDIRETLKRHKRLKLTPSYLWLDRNYSVSFHEKNGSHGGQERINHDTFFTQTPCKTEDRESLMDLL